MSSDVNICPKCKRPTPPDVDSGICPFCALEIAMAELSGLGGDSDLPAGRPIENVEEPLPESQNNGSGFPPSMHLSSFVSSYGPRFAAALFVVVTIYVGARLIWDLNHIRPSLKFDSDLHLAFDLTEYGRAEEDTLIEINGIEVSDVGNLSSAYDAGSRDRVQFLFQTFNGVAFLTWVPFNETLEYTVIDDGAIIPAAGSKFPDLELGADEVVSAINGISLSGITEPATDTQFREPSAGLRTRFSITANDTGATREVIVQKYDRRSYWSRFFVGLIFGSLGIMGYWLRPGSRVAKSFLFFCVFLAATWYSRAIPFYIRVGPENLAYHLLQCFIFAPCILFIVTFTPMRAVVRRPWLWVSMGGLVGFALLSANLFWVPNVARFGLLHFHLYRVWAAIVLGLVLFCLSARAIAFLARKPISPTDRQRNLVLWFAVFVGFLPASAYNLVRFSTGTQLTYMLPFETLVIVFPIIVLYAILRHNLLNLNELAREGVIYGFLLMGITLGYAGLASVSAPFFETFLSSEQQWLKTGLMAGVFTVAIPLHNRVRHRIDLRFSRIPLEYEDFISSLESRSSSDSSPLEYCQTVVDQLQQVTRAMSVTIFTNFEEYGGWSRAAVAPTPRIDQTTERCQALLRYLEDRKAVVFREDILEDSNLGDLREDVLDGFNALQAEAFYPLVAYGRVVGALALGEKESHKNYRAPEIKSLIRIGTYVAQNISNLLGRITAMQGRRIVDIFPRYPDQIGRYVIREVIGEGGMAYVYLGIDDVCEVAIKVPNRQVQGSALLMERFRREVSAMQSLIHPNIVRVIEVSWHVNEPYVVLEYLSNGSIDTILKSSGPFSEMEALEVILQVARGLKAALAEGVVHRDIKPRNLFRTNDGAYKIGDFGLAAISGSTPLTETGELFGTPYYMSPEMVRGESTDWRSDQYALGITLYELLAGTKPFRGEKYDAILYQHVHEPVPDIRRRRSTKVTQPVRTIIDRMLEKDRTDRYESYGTLIEALEMAKQGLNVIVKTKKA